jgi:UDP-glucose 4-epimerase
MKILVTGGAGFIGSHLVDAYIDAGYEVLVIDNLSTGSRQNLNPRAKFFELDIRDKEVADIFATERPDIVNHHAAQISVTVSTRKPIFDADINILGTLNILENATKYGVQKIIFASTGGAIYGDADEYPTTENYAPIPVSPYAIAKFSVEKYLHYYFYQFGVKYLVLRYANVYGPRQIPHGEAGVVSIFIENLLQKKESHLYVYPDESDGMVRDYVFVGDVVNANLQGLEIGDNEVVNIGTGKPTTTGTLYRQIATLMRTDIPPKLMGARPGDIHRSCLNISKASEILNWYPKTSLEEGIEKTIDYFAKRRRDK